MVDFSEALLVTKDHIGEFRINDLKFNIPPESISIQSLEFVNPLITMREHSPSVRSRSEQRKIISIPIIIDTSSDEEVDKLSRLIIQTRKFPLAVIENEKIRKELRSFVGDANIPVTVNQISGEPDKNLPSILRVHL